jgi:hypothetical protein
MTAYLFDANRASASLNCAEEHYHALPELLKPVSALRVCQRVRSLCRAGEMTLQGNGVCVFAGDVCLLPL